MHLKRKVIAPKWNTLPKRLTEVKAIVENAKGLTVEYDVHHDTMKPEVVAGRITHRWFQENISDQAIKEGYNGAVLFFSKKDAKKWGIDSGLRGSTQKDGDHFDEMWVCTDEKTRDSDGYRIVRTLAHEEGHTIEHRGITGLDVHDYDDDQKGDLETFFADVDATKTATLRALLAALQALLPLLIRKRDQLAITHPVENFKTYVSQAYGVRNKRYPKTGRHIGTDYACPEGTPVLAPKDGQVTASGYSPALGNFCHFTYEHDTVKYTARFLHLQSVPTQGTYTRGSEIGRSGKTGDVTGQHLHVDVWLPEVRLDLIDTKNWKTLTTDPERHFAGV